MAPLASVLFQATASSAATTESRAASRLRSTCGSAAASSRSCGATTASLVDGESAEACVVATPAHAVRFHPPLPEWKQRALDAVRYGEAAKLFLPLEHEVEPSATLSVTGRFWTWTEHGSSAVASFAGTSAALTALDITSGPERWAAAVRRLRPDLPFTDAEPVLATWPGGAYSARSLMSPLDDQALARKVGPIAFAGEHTAGEWHGLMEGALRSGLRAAAQCLDGFGLGA